MSYAQATPTVLGWVVVEHGPDDPPIAVFNRVTPREDADDLWARYPSFASMQYDVCAVVPAAELDRLTAERDEALAAVERVQAEIERMESPRGNLSSRFVWAGRLRAALASPSATDPGHEAASGEAGRG